MILIQVALCAALSLIFCQLSPADRGAIACRCLVWKKGDLLCSCVTTTHATSFCVEDSCTQRRAICTCHKARHLGLMEFAKLPDSDLKSGERTVVIVEPTPFSGALLVVGCNLAQNLQSGYERRRCYETSPSPFST